jgi:hypothetical protein
MRACRASCAFNVSGAMYHVMSRGDRGERIFLDDVDRHDFIKASPKPVRRQLSKLGLDLRPKLCGHDERPTNVALSCPMPCCQWQLLVPNFAHEFLRTSR